VAKINITKRKFEAYEAVRVSGITNMFDTRVVSKYSDLTREECVDIIKNYGKYIKKYPTVRQNK